MTAILNAGWKLKMWQLNISRDTRGQDLTECALMAGFLAAGCAAALPNLAAAIVTVLAKVVAVLSSTDPTTAPGG